MKLNCTFEMISMSDEIIAVPVGESAKIFHGVLKVNKAGAELLNLLTVDTSAEEITSVLVSKYENDHDELLQYAENFISYLEKNSLLER